MTPLPNQMPVSIRAPREGGRWAVTLLVACQKQFQSAPPVKGGDGVAKGFKVVLGVSIRAPREGGRFAAISSALRFARVFQSAPPVKGGDLIPDPASDVC